LHEVKDAEALSSASVEAEPMRDECDKDPALRCSLLFMAPFNVPSEWQPENGVTKVLG
jgi:hypothetical protein